MLTLSAVGGQVKFREDNMGWEWLDVGPVEAGHGKYKDTSPAETGHGRYKAVFTQSWQKEVDVSCGGSSPMMKSRTTQLWDASVGIGSTSTLHAAESFSNTKFGPLNTGNVGMMDSRETVLKTYGQSYRGASATSDVGSGQLHTASPHESLSRDQGYMGVNMVQSMSNSGQVDMSNEHNLTNDGGQRYSSAGQQVSASVRNGKGINYWANRWTEGQEYRTRENDSLSNFELRLGQPSQQTQAAGTSFSSMATSSVDHPKPHLFEQVTSKVWDGKLQHNLQPFSTPNLPKFSGIPGQARMQHGVTAARQSAPVRTDRLESFGLEKRGEDRGPAYHNLTQSTRQIFHSLQGAYEPNAVPDQVQGKFMSLESIHQSSMLSRSGDSQFRSVQSGSEKVATKLISQIDQSRSMALENGTSLDSLSTGELAQLTHKTGQKFLEAANQSSFTYRATELDGPGVQLKGALSRGIGAENLSNDVDMFGRASVGARASFSDILMRSQGQHDPGISSRGAVDNANGSRLEQDPKLGFQVREQGTTLMVQPPAHRLAQGDYSARCEEIGRAPGVEHVSEGQKIVLNRTEMKQWQSQNEQTVMDDRQALSQGDTEAVYAIVRGVVSKVQNSEISNRLSSGDGGIKGNEAEHVHVQSEPLADPAAKEVGVGDAPGAILQRKPEVPSVTRGEIQCACFKCRKASPCTRGQAVPRFTGQVCLKEVNGLASTVEDAKRVGLVEGEHVALECCAQVQQLDTEPRLNTDPAEEREATRDSIGQALPWEPRQGGTDVENQDVSAKCEEVIPEEKDGLSDTAAKGTTSGRGSPLSAACRDVCSNSSENVSSGLSDEGCAASGKGCPLMQKSGVTAAAGVVDEGSGIGKCSSSEDVDMGVGTNPNALSVSKDSRKHASPSSLECPSSSNMGKRLVMKRGIGGYYSSKETEHNEVEAEPVTSTGILERKQRRNMKWKLLELDGDRGAAKDVSPTSSFGHGAEAPVTSEKVRLGSQVHEAHARADTDFSTKDLKALSGEMLPPSKRRKLAIPKRHQEVKTTNVTEENVEAASLGEDSKNKASTLVKRVPTSGVNRQNVKKGIRTKLQLNCGGKDWRSNAGGDGCPDIGYSSEAGMGMSTTPKTGALSIVSATCGSGSGKADNVCPIAVPTFLTKSLRSPRTPLARPSPRHAKIMSLSVILKHAKDANPVPREVQNRPTEQKLRDGFPESRNEGTIQRSLDAHVASSSVTARHGKEVNDRQRPDMRVSWKASKPRIKSIMHKADAHVATHGITADPKKEVMDRVHSNMGIACKISKSRVEGALQKRDDARACSDSVRAGHSKEVKDRYHPDTDVVFKEERRMRLMHKEDALNRKVRSLLELTCKNNTLGPGAEVFEFAEDEDPAAVLKADKLASAAVEMDNPAPRPASMGINGPIPRGERSARPGVPNRRKVEWHRSKDAQIEQSKSENLAAERERRITDRQRTSVCDLSQVRPASGNSISKVKHQQGLGEQGCLVRKQVRSSKVNIGKVTQDELQVKDARAFDDEVRVGDTGAVKHDVRHIQKGGITGLGVLKRKPQLLSLPGIGAKRSKLAPGLKRVKESSVYEIERSMENGALSKSSKGELVLDNKKLKEPVESRLGSNMKVHLKGKPTNSKEVVVTYFNKEKSVASFEAKKPNPHERSKCDVCGIFTSASYNKLLCCSRCPVKVHQACYGVPKIPKGPWSCRTCKFKVTNPICVLCGYGGGAMTRVHKSRSFCHGLLRVWRDMKDESILDSFIEDDEETLLSATKNNQLSRNKSTSNLPGKDLKINPTNVRECDSCDCEEPRDENSVRKVCHKDSPEHRSSGGNMVKHPDRVVTANSGHESWLRNNTVRSILKDVAAKQWAHMVCALWMPGTRCLNMGTMGVFDVSNVNASLRKMLCSICHRRGGACIQCRVPNCSTPIHVWCAHEKGLLQSEIVQDGSNRVGFFGKCQTHGDYCGSESDDVAKEGICTYTRESCVRTEGYKGKLSLEERAKAQQRMTLEGGLAVTPEQVTAALRIDVRKISSRRSLKPATSALKCDQREYLRFKQKKGWKRLAVYKSGIHALGLYTTDFIAEGEVVVEYVGEIVGSRVADKREAEYHSGKRLQYQGACYLFRIDTEQIIDATRKGGIARFVNHSCSPNCVAKVICVENLKKVVFFAKRNIYAAEEVTYDYKFNCDEVGDKIPCFCGSPECRGTLN
ncbi:uncharacterized protein [Physcomitrium patens]|uniref:uncharacterized protein isoform X1 n=1 Tax=Physcomitrium patens TaxID=3218 RepID=UPI003CCDA189